MQRNAEVVQALHHVATQARRMRHQLVHAHHLGSLRRQTARHDQPDVSRPEDHRATPGQAPLEVHEVLRAARREHARRTRARQVERAQPALARAGGQHHGARRDGMRAARVHRVHRERRSVVRAPRIDGRHAGARQHVHRARVRKRVDLALRVLGTRQLHAEAVQPEPVVHALLEDAAQLLLAVEQKHARALLRGRLGCGDAGCPAARHRHVVDMRALALRVLRLRPLALARQLRVIGARSGHHGRSRQALVQHVGRHARLARHDARDLRRAEPAVAAPHHRARAPLQRVERQHGQRSVQRGHDLGLGHLAAAAHDVPPPRVGLDGARTLGLVALGERLAALATRLEFPVRLRAQLFRHRLRHVLGYGRSRGEPRRVEAGDVEEPGRVVRFADDEVVAVGVRGAQPCEVRDHAARAGVGPRLLRGVQHEAQPLRARRQVDLAGLLHGVRPHQQVAVHGGRHEHALAR